MNHQKIKPVLEGLFVTILILAGLGYWFYPYYLSKTINPVAPQIQPVKEPTQPLSLAEYQDYLNSLDRSQPAAVAGGIRVLERSIPHYSGKDADLAFLAFNTFYIEAQNHCNETFWRNEALIAKIRSATQGMTADQIHEYLNQPSALQKDPEIKEFARQISSGGFVLKSRAGNFYLVENPDFFYNKFSKYLSESLREFLDLRRRETAEGFTANGDLLISFKKIGERIINWEVYLDKYPDSPLKELADYHRQLYLGVFLFGMEDSRTFERKRLKPELKAVYEDFSERFSATKSGDLIGRYYEVLRANDYQYTKEVADFLETNQVQIYPGLQL
ncbi:MAG: hypothetical protein GX075_13050 [Firmicutes bacterium]|nr:hypothetical protein [Bacillota bacterium]